MFEHFTDHARAVLQLEGIEAQRMHHAYLGTEHLLLGLIREPEGHGHRALQNLNVDLKLVRQAVRKLAQKGPSTDIPDRLPHTQHFQHVIRVAIQEARALKSPDVGTEHLLLALLQETDGVAVRALEKINVKAQTVRDEILRMLEEEQAAV
ncbi:MAG: Clp protease N-terminal domain-containing protein [Phycisphaerae bacterium]